ncbi:hypothetical protein L570_1680 [Bordetella pertussis 2356847]|nr:hypothetical protein L570_1680 [Bordetella pertussis 2356847]
MIGSRSEPHGAKWRPDSSVWRFLQWQHRAGAPGGASHDDLRKRRYRQCSRI